ncbi:MAG: DNA mismatch repair endonuclease MutL [Candidatus Tectomicrobia bacterium]|uniref:DNA mismatch repair protein MutL n=1 Tax=Tectimicrobiota bacterium TaxID=2528274 RepID=A0A933GPA3_UNCTE|nr:DNA mismatch repair endonuclease MutL [Candidatus Tectomicrobia bacterium]
MSEKTKIRIMPEDLANKIAAGEVVERPASVVKELLENSLDAEATVLIVEIEAGGKRLIRVSDNGCGMSPDDALLAFERHATSKIKCFEDLDDIHTLGFRGEALPSIASVSRLRLLTLPHGENAGTSITIEGGVIKKVAPAGCPPGTTLEIKNLFYNTPARLKFLRSEQTEFQQIARIITQLAMANPQASFRFLNIKREVLNTPAVTQLDHRIASLFGLSLTNHLIPIDFKGTDLKVSGFVSQPEFSKSDRENQFLFVNKRPVRNQLINKVSFEIYSNIFPKDRHPAIFLFLETDPVHVDVNVHPTKAEVRFRNPQTIMDMVRQCLNKTWLRPHLVNAPSRRPNEEEEKIPVFLPRKEKSQDSTVEGRDSSFEHKNLLENKTAPESEAIASQILAPADPAAPSKVFDEAPKIRGLQPTLPLKKLQQYRILGQLHNSFVILETEKGLLLLDQHCAHERVLYERLLSSVRKGRVQSQQLLFPERIELPFNQARLIEKKLAQFDDLGFHLEPFGGSCFLLRAVPALLEGRDSVNLVLEISDLISREYQSSQKEKILEEIITRMACHGAIKANQSLKSEELNALLRELDNTQYPYTCPHGRPVTLLLDMVEIKKRFLRQ